MKDTIHILIVLFKNRIEQREVPLFRGAVIHALQDTPNLLYHNHTEEGFRYAYPLIQYKRIHGQAAIVCIKEGSEAIGQFFANASRQLSIGTREVVMEIESVRAHQILVQPWNSTFGYRIRCWLPLNADNYHKYQFVSSLSERIAMLEKILIGNLLSFAKGINLYVEQPVTCSITSLSTPYPILHKGIKLMAFDVECRSNLSIPDYVGIGKNASMGCGVIRRMGKKEESKDEEKE
jgi:hypothetical protein